jgi:hypothetical protein
VRPSATSCLAVGDSCLIVRDGVFSPYAKLRNSRSATDSIARSAPFAVGAQGVDLLSQPREPEPRGHAGMHLGHLDDAARRAFGGLGDVQRRDQALGAGHALR